MAFTVRLSPPRRTRRTQRAKSTGLLLRVLGVLCGGEFSYGYRKTIAEPVEQPVGRDEQEQRGDAEGQQPPPVPDRYLEEEDLLVGHREVREGIQIEQPLVLLHVRLEHRIDDRGREEPERQDVGQQIADIAEMDGQRGEDQR